MDDEKILQFKIEKFLNEHNPIYILKQFNMIKKLVCDNSLVFVEKLNSLPSLPSIRKRNQSEPSALLK